MILVLQRHSAYCHGVTFGWITTIWWRGCFVQWQKSSSTPTRQYRVFTKIFTKTTDRTVVEIAQHSHQTVPGVHQDLHQNYWSYSGRNRAALPPDSTGCSPRSSPKLLIVQWQKSSSTPTRHYKEFSMIFTKTTDLILRLHIASHVISKNCRLTVFG